MQYHRSSYHLEYLNSKFDSALELTWFLFLSGLDITKNNLSSHPLDYKFGLSWYPDLRFIIFNPLHTEVFAEVKPLSKSQFYMKLNISKYKYKDSETCILGASNLDYQFLNNSIELTKLFDDRVLVNSDKWRTCSENANEFARKYSSNKGHSISRLDFGKYKGYTLREIQEKDPGYYKWYMDTFD
ncbi:MAG: hypothetical protein IT214_01740 [Chitinophagaceae bacterium]|nr:hypothetical protein [Chitinophagaceae bacterium]